jgi:hypothetical protein
MESTIAAVRAWVVSVVFHVPVTTRESLLHGVVRIFLITGPFDPAPAAWKCIAVKGVSTASRKILTEYCSESRYNVNVRVALAVKPETGGTSCAPVAVRLGNEIVCLETLKGVLTTGPFTPAGAL